MSEKIYKIKENPAILMRKILDSLECLKETYRWHQPIFNKVQRLHKYCLDLIYGERVQFYEWFISKVMYETIDDAYDNLKVVLGT